MRRRRRELDFTPARIGVMKTTGIGDMVLATAVTRDVLERFPASEVVLIGGPDNAEIAALVGGARALQLPTSQPWAAVPLLRAQRLDVLLDLGQWSRLEAIYAALSGARWTAGFRTGGHQRHGAYDVAVEHSNQKSELENFRQVVRCLGVEPERLPSFPAKPLQSPPAPLPYVVFHLWPGGFRSELREWPADSWRELASRVVQRGFPIVLTGAADDAARTEAFIESCGGLASSMTSVAGAYPLAQLVDVLGAARCVVSVNTGVMHLAAAVGVATVALNGPTSSMRWGPIGANAASVDSTLPGCGYLNLGSEYDGQRTDCMKGISVDRVAHVVFGSAGGE